MRISSLSAVIFAVLAIAPSAAGAAVRHAALASVMFCLFAAAVVIGVHIMLSKS